MRLGVVVVIVANIDIKECGIYVCETSSLGYYRVMVKSVK